MSETGMNDPYSRELRLNTTFPALPSLRREWDISPETFNTFLAWLDPNREEAGRKYEEIRGRLIKIFASRGCSCPEDLADETISRVIVKSREIGEAYEGEPARYFGGVARNVFHEYSRKRTVHAAGPPSAPPEPRTEELDCLDKCLAEIPENQRILILQYYQGEKGRKIRNRDSMARELGMESNALRIRACRIRGLLHRCVADCLAGGKP